MASSSETSFAVQLGQLLIDGFFDLEPFPSPLDFITFSRQCVVYYYLMKLNPERKFPKILEMRFQEMMDNIMLRGTMMNALPFMDQTSDVVTDTNPHFARILQYTQNIRRTLAVPTGSEMKEPTSTFKYEACPPCSPTSSGCDVWTPPSSGPPSTILTPKLNLPVKNLLSIGHSGLEGANASSTIDAQKSRLSFHPSTNGIRVDHPGTEVLWQHLTDAVRAACTLPPENRKVSTIMDQCLRDVMLAERMPDQLLKILPEDSEAFLVKDGSNLVQQVFDGWDLGEEEDASDCEDYIMDELKSNLPKLCAALHFQLADSVLCQTISRFGGVLSMVLQDQTHIEEIVYIWLDLAISAVILIVDTEDERLEYQSISESTRRHIIPLGLLGSCRKSLSALESYDCLTVCLDSLLDHNKHTFAPDNKVLLPEDWIDDALEALANGVSRYAVYLRGVAQQAAINLQHADDFEEAK